MSVAAKRVLFVTKDELGSSARYRARNYFPRLLAAGWLPEQCVVDARPGSRWALLRAARRADVVVVCRKTFTGPLRWLLRRCAKRLVFDFDDAIFCRSDGTPSKSRGRRFAAMACCCDWVWAGNSYLASEAARYNPATILVPTVLETSQYLIDIDKESSPTLVWIGSRSTRKYLEAVLPWLELAARQVPGLTLRIVADFELPGERLHVQPVTWSRETEAQALASAWIGISPLRDDAWTRGKCGLKVLQYMAAGLPVITSPCGVNRELVLDGVTGAHAADAPAWVAAIARLCMDTALRKSMGQAGRQRVAAYSTAVGVRTILELLLPY